MMKMMVAGMVVAAGESLRMTSSGQPFACEDRARCPPAEEKAATESSRQRAFHQPTNPPPTFLLQPTNCFHLTPLAT